MKFESNLNLQKNEIQNAKIQNLSSAPSSPVQGQMYFDTTLVKFAIYNGSTWVYMATDADVTASLTGLKWKDACLVATTANITLSGTQTIDGVSVVADDRVLVKDQSTASENGIYLCKSGAWQRTTDGDSGSELVSAIIPITKGTTNADLTYRITNDTITIGVTSITITAFGSSVPTATTTTEGKVELATTGETEARSDTTRAVTPSGLANFGFRQTFNLGDGSSVDLVVTHNYGHRAAIWQVFRQASPYDQILVDIEQTTTNTTTFKFASAPSSNQFLAVGIG